MTRLSQSPIAANEPLLTPLICSVANIIEEVTKKEEDSHPAPQDVNSNFGSGVGSPFKSSSTQPVSSIFGGPAINITG